LKLDAEDLEVAGLGGYALGAAGDDESGDRQVGARRERPPPLVVLLVALAEHCCFCDIAVCDVCFAAAKRTVGRQRKRLLLSLSFPLMVSNNQLFSLRYCMVCLICCCVWSLRSE
jgi:hypothetical protein